MFKELKVIKLLVLVGLLVTILLRTDFLNLTIYQLFTDKLSYSVGDQVKIFGSSKAKYPVFGDALVSSLDGKELEEVKLNLVQSRVEVEDILRTGDDIQDYISLELNESYKPGIYLVANKYPFVVRGESAEVTVVYPHMNNLIYQKLEEQNAISLNVPKTSMNRTAQVDEFTLGLKSTFAQLQSSYATNFITDLDLEQEGLLTATKLLIIYGKSAFWTPKMKANFKDYMNSGGNVLLICSYAMNNVCWYNEQDHAITLYDESRAKSIESYLGYDGDAPRFVIGASYLYGGFSDELNLTVNQQAHPIFIGASDVKIRAELYNSPPVKWKKDIPFAVAVDTNFYKASILAYGKSTTPYDKPGVKGIFELQPTEQGGQIISFGAEEWCLEKDQKIIQNAVDYLMQLSR